MVEKYIKMNSTSLGFSKIKTKTTMLHSFIVIRVITVKKFDNTK